MGTILKALASSKTSVIATMILQNSQREKPEIIGMIYYHLMSQKKLNAPDYTSSPKSNCQTSLLGKNPKYKSLPRMQTDICKGS
jgi:hypothetical protein